MSTISINPADNNAQHKIDGSSVGDRLLFMEGRHNLTSPVRLRGGRTYAGDEGAEIFNRFAEHAFRVVESGAKIEGLIFDGAGIRYDSGPSGPDIASGLVNNCKFRVRKIADTAHCGIIFEAQRITNTLFTNNVFDTIEGDAGIYGYFYDGLIIANNEFLNGSEGIHIIDHSDKSRGLLIEQNYADRLSRIFIELQGGGINTLVQDNWYEKSDDKITGDTYAYSIINDRAQNPVVRRNVARMRKSSEYPDGIGPRIIFELGGSKLLCEDNYSDGGNHVIAVNGSNATGEVRNNCIRNYREGPRNSNGARVVFGKNDGDVRLSFNPDVRGRPFPNRRYGNSPPPVEEPAPGSDLSGRVAALEQASKANADAIAAIEAQMRKVREAWKQ